MVGALAIFDFPLGQWLDLVPALASNANHESVSVRVAALETLGYICQDLPSPEVLSKELSDQVIGALLVGMGDKANPEVRQHSLKALYNAISFCEANFHNPEEASAILTAVNGALEDPEEEHQVIAMQILVEVGRGFYEHLDTFIVPLQEVTFRLASSGGDKVGAQAVEFWSSICEEEHTRTEEGRLNKTYINMYFEALVDMLLVAITRLNFEEDEDGEEWGVSASSGCCLRLLAQYANDAVVDKVLAFVSMHLGADEWNRKHVALVALGAILDGPSKSKLAELLKPGLKTALLPCYDYASVRIRETVAWVFSQIAEHLHEILVTEDLPECLQKFVMGLQDKPQIANYNCAVFAELAKAL